MWLAGTPLSDDLVVELVKRLRLNGAEHTAQTVYSAALKGRSTAVLDRYDRGNILAVLDDRPTEFAELHNRLRQIERHGRNDR